MIWRDISILYNYIIVDSAASDLKRHIHAVQKSHRDYRCESCDKSFSEAQTLKRPIHVVHVHKGHKDYKCEYCGTSYSNILRQDIWRGTSMMFMKAKRISLYTTLWFKVNASES